MTMKIYDEDHDEDKGIDLQCISFWYEIFILINVTFTELNFLSKNVSE